jgi:predicted ATP-dependent endonuclease of OLD family
VRLTKVQIEGYRSIKDKLVFHVDKQVTVVLGANDHGKSNLLEALLHLNTDTPFDLDRDLNWDCEDEQERLPLVEWEFRLSDEERSSLGQIDHAFRSIEAIDEFQKELTGEIKDAGQRRAELAKVAKQKQAEASEAAARVEQPEQEPAEGEEAAASDAASLNAASEGAQRDAEAAATAVEEASTAVEALNLARDLAEAQLIEFEAQINSVDAERGLEAETAAAQAELEEAKTALADAEERFQNTTKAAQASPDDADEKKALERAERDRNRSAGRVARAEQRCARVERALEARRRSEDEDLSPSRIPPSIPQPKDAELPKTVIARRQGIGNALEMQADPSLGDGSLAEVVRKMIPRVELIPPGDLVPDSVNAEELESDDFAFMRGIFHYAGLRSEEWQKIFEYGSVSSRRLEDASEELTNTLRASWRQGERLSFKLDHDSANERIDLWIKDPAVRKGFTRASRRSLGFTRFFSLKTILHAHEQEHRSSSYIWVFDEPGLHLHPDGQHDLVQVIETLAQANQVVYSTHSVFMANKNFPVRHRLIMKDERGTTLDGKPFRSRWKPALGALGLSMPGSLLFASRVLLVEGDSDVILLNALFQKLIELEQFEQDINHLAIMATGDAPDAAALVRILCEMASPPRVAILFDGDEGGKQREDYLADLLTEKKVGVLRLSNGTTIEDHTPAASRLFIKALAGFTAKLPGVTKSAEDLEQELREGLTGSGIVSPKELTSNVASWAREKARELAELESKPSALGTAREYSILLDDDETVGPLTGTETKRAQALANVIANELKLPGRVLEQPAIVGEP